jgi:hypothetical protein
MEMTIFSSIISPYFCNSIRTDFNFFSTIICACRFHTSILSTSNSVRLAYSFLSIFH